MEDEIKFDCCECKYYQAEPDVNYYGCALECEHNDKQCREKAEDISQ